MTGVESPESAGGADAVVVRSAEPADGVRWNRFVAQAGAGSFYHRFEWRGILRQSLALDAIYLLAERGDRIVGVLPLVLLSSRLFGRILCSMPFLNYGGPCAETETAARALIDEAVRRADRAQVEYLELRCAVPAPTELAVSRQKVSMTIALDADPEVLWNGFKPKHRKNIRRAMKNDLSVRSGSTELLDEFYGLGYNEAAIIDLLVLVNVMSFTNYAYRMMHVPIDFPSAKEI